MIVEFLVHRYAPGMRSPHHTGTSPIPPLSGVDRLLSDPQALDDLCGRTIGLLTNHASTTAAGIPVALAIQSALQDLPGTYLRLLSPEHGLWPVTRAGDAVASAKDSLTSLRVHSLYQGESGDLSLADVEIDVLIIDLRDVGVRCFTYAATAAMAVRDALTRGIDVVVCDRANPLGPNAAGPRPEPGHHSLLAFFDTPFIHGTTLGALVKQHAESAQGPATMKIYPADIETSAPLGWLPPSPALAHPDAVAAYGGLVLLEATNVSEGRGTSLSFRSVSAPGIDGDAMAAALASWNTGFTGRAGQVFHTREVHAGEALPGVVLWPRSKQNPDPLALGIHILAWLRRHHRDFEWRMLPSGGYAIDSLFARSDAREMIEAGIAPADILASWGTPAG